MTIRVQAQSNKPVVQPGIEQTGYGANPAALQAAARASGQIGNAVRGLAGVITQIEQDNDNIRLLTAQNAYSAEINELHRDILENRRLGNAQGAAEYFRTKEQEIRSRIYAESGIKYKDTQNRFDIQTERMAIAEDDAISRFEVDEIDKNFGIQNENFIRATISSAVKSGDIHDIIEGVKSMDETIAAQAGRFGDDQVKLLQNNALTRMVQAGAKERIEASDVTGAEALIAYFSGRLSEEVISDIRASIRLDAKQQSIRTDALKYEGTNLTPQQMLDQYYAEGGADIESYNIPISSGDNPDLDGLNDGLKNALPVIGGVLQSLGVTDGAEITSGYRNAERNAQAGGTAKSYHLYGDAVDIYLPAIKNKNDPKYQQIKDTLSPYFSEIDYHDVGSGLHLHLGGYKGGLESGKDAKPGKVTKDIAYFEQVYAYVQQQRVIEQNQKAQFIQQNVEAADTEMWQLYQAGVTDFDQYAAVAKRYSFNAPLTEKLNAKASGWYKSIAGCDDEFDARAKLELEAKAALGQAGWTTEDEMWREFGDARLGQKEQYRIGGIYKTAVQSNDAIFKNLVQNIEAGLAQAGISKDAGNYTALLAGSQKVVQERIAEYRKNAKSDPSDVQVITFARESVAAIIINTAPEYWVDNFFGRWITKTNEAELRAAGIEKIEAGSKPGEVIVYFAGGSKPVTMTQKEAEKTIAGTSDLTALLSGIS